MPQNYVANSFILYIAKCYCNNNNAEPFIRTALTMMGIKDINECPDGVNEDRISHETFKTEA